MRAFKNEFVLTFIWVSRIIPKKKIPVLAYALNYCL